MLMTGVAVVLGGGGAVEHSINSWPLTAQYPRYCRDIYPGRQQEYNFSIIRHNFAVMRRRATATDHAWLEQPNLVYSGFDVCTWCKHKIMMNRLNDF